ncbi:hypothetical protein BDW71DRAFT_57724 [Aspergillus fruticulosus]
MRNPRKQSLTKRKRKKKKGTKKRPTAGYIKRSPTLDCNPSDRFLLYTDSACLLPSEEIPALHVFSNISHQTLGSRHCILSSAQPVGYQRIKHGVTRKRRILPRNAQGPLIFIRRIKEIRLRLSASSIHRRSAAPQPLLDDRGPGRTHYSVLPESQLRS